MGGCLQEWLRMVLPHHQGAGLMPCEEQVRGKRLSRLLFVRRLIRCPLHSIIRSVLEERLGRKMVYVACPQRCTRPQLMQILKGSNRQQKLRRSTERMSTTETGRLRN